MIKWKFKLGLFLFILCVVALLSISLLFYIWDFDSSKLVPNVQKAETASVGLLMLPTTDVLPHQDPTQVMLASDRLVGMIATINSIKSNTAHPLRFYLVTSQENVQYLRTWIMESKLRDISFIIRSPASTFPGPNGPNEINLAKAYIPLIFPEVEGPLVYIEDDCIVQRDIRQLASALIQPEHFGVFSTDCNSVSRRFTFVQATYANYVNFNNHKIKALRINPAACSFNTGVFMVNVTGWKRNNWTEKIDFWMHLNRKEKIVGNQDIGDSAHAAIMLAFYNKITTMDPMWNVRHLGVSSAARYSRHFLQQAKLLHWDGPFKPWGRRSSNTEFWQRYYVPDPTGRFHLVRKKLGTGNY